MARESTALAYQDDAPAVQMSRGNNDRLSYDELADILRLARQGKSQREIAQIIGCSQPSISYALKHMAGSADDVKAVIKAKVLSTALPAWEKAIDKAADRGDHRPAREFIEAGHAELRPQVGNSAGGVGVQVIIGMPGQPVELPVIEVSQAKAPFRPLELAESESETQPVSD